MNKTGQARLIISRLDEQSEGTSPVHRLSPLSKLIITIVFIGITTSYGKYEIPGLIVMAALLGVWYQFAQLSLGECVYRLRYVMPLVIIMGIPNLFFDRLSYIRIAGIVINSGFISMLTLIFKGLLCLVISYVFIATTSVEEICIAMRKMHVPAFFTTLILLTFRFISILLDEVSIMTDAYKLRAPGQKGIVFGAWGSFLGQLIIRSSDRAQNLYESMVLRGYKGEINYMGHKTYNSYSALIALIVIGLMFLVRFINVTELVGGLLI